MVSFQRLGGVPFAESPASSLCRAAPSRDPTPALRLREVCVYGGRGVGGSRAIRPRVVHLHAMRAAAPATRTVLRAHLAPGQPRACPPAARSSVPAHVAAAPHARTSPRPARPCPQRRCVSRPRVTHRLPALPQPGLGPSAAPAAPAAAAARWTGRCLLARSQPAAIPRAARPCAWPGRSSVEPPRGRTGKRGWSRPSPSNAALPAALLVHSRMPPPCPSLSSAPSSRDQGSISRSALGIPNVVRLLLLGRNPVC